MSAQRSPGHSLTFVCGVISGPHDCYGARMVRVATFVALMALARRFGGDVEAR